MLNVNMLTVASLVSTSLQKPLSKQVDARPLTRGPLRHMPTTLSDYWLQVIRKMQHYIRRYVYNGPMTILVLV